MNLGRMIRRILKLNDLAISLLSLSLLLVISCSPAIEGYTKTSTTTTTTTTSAPKSYDLVVKPKVHTNIIDGPYVFHKKGQTTIKNIKREGMELIVDERAIDIKQESSFYCLVDPKVGKPFKVNLLPKITAPASYYKNVEKLIAISDIEGNFKLLTETLQGNGVINEDYQWIYGKGHLVVLGDLFDRGDDVIPCLWLLYELEQQALSNGGGLHFINGNHEEMNFRGDIRYVRDKYKMTARKLKVSYRYLFGKSSELGRWLLSKNIAERINTTIYTHGGLSPELLHHNLSLDAINDIARTHYGVDSWRLKQTGGRAAMIFGKKGPMWYRGYFNNLLTQKEMDNLLAAYGAKNIVVGHTVVSDICSLYDQRVYAIDVKHKMVVAKSMANVLFYNNGDFFKSDILGRSSEIEAYLSPDAIRVFKAIANNNKSAVASFLQKGNDVNGYYSKDKYTLIHYTIKSNNNDIFLFLLKNGADPNLIFQDKTPLMYAIKYKNMDAIKYLLQNGVDVNKENYNNKTALYYAAKYGSPEIARILIDSGAKVNHKNHNGESPIEYALKNNNRAVADYLISLQ